MSLEPTLNFENYLTSLALVRSRLGAPPSPQSNADFRSLVSGMTREEMFDTINAVSCFAALILEMIPDISTMATGVEWVGPESGELAGALLDDFMQDTLAYAVNVSEETGG